MEKHTVSRDDRYHEAWPQICIAANGNLVCAYAEADVHGGGSVSSAVVRISKDEGRTWSDPIVVDALLEGPMYAFMMCRSVICLQDGSLLLAVDWNDSERVKAQPPGAPHAWSDDPTVGQYGEARLYRSMDNGQTWTGPEGTGCLTNSLLMRQISDGTVFLSAYHYRCQGLYSFQVVYRSVDNGKTWSEPITVWDDPDYPCGEGDIVEMPGGELVMYIRENSMRVCAGAKAISYDHGLTWKGPFAAGKWPIVGRVAAGRLSSGEVLVMQRVGGLALQNHYGFFIETPETALARIPYNNQARFHPPASHWGIIDNDTSPYADYGYGGWVELAGGDVYAVDYIVDDAPKHRPQIRGYRISREELLNPKRDIIIDFEPPEYKRGKLAGQNGWVQQKPEFWKTRGLAPGKLGNQGNYVLVDVSGRHSCSGKASITGSQNEGGGEEVLRRDVGPYDLVQENVGVCLTHSGRQHWGMFRVLDAAGETLVELRSDFVHDCLWLKYGQGYETVSDINCEEGWWETNFDFTRQECKIYTRRAGGKDWGRPWCTIPISAAGKYDIKDEINPDLAGTGKLDRVIAAIVVVMGGRGALYFDRIKINTVQSAAQAAADEESG